MAQLRVVRSLADSVEPACLLPLCHARTSYLSNSNRMSPLRWEDFQQSMKQVQASHNEHLNQPKPTTFCIAFSRGSVCVIMYITLHALSLIDYLFDGHCKFVEVC